MSKLELKIPPVLVVVIFAFLMWLMTKFTVDVEFLMSYRWMLCVPLFCLGGIFSLLGVASFKTAQTTVNPTKPEASSALVKTGIYQYSRNPMYVGFLFILLAWGFLLSNAYAIAITPGFVFYLNRFQIRPEEKMLSRIFGDEFCGYQKRVRRWL